MSKVSPEQVSPHVSMRCKRMPDPTLIWGDVMICSLLAGGLAGLTLGGERFAYNWFSLGFAVLMALIFVFIATQREVHLTGTTFTIDGMVTRSVDLARVKEARLTLLPGNVMILDVQPRKRWKSLRIEGDDIGPMREALLNLVKPEAVIDLRPRVEA